MCDNAQKYIEGCHSQIIEEIDRDAFIEVGNCYCNKLYKAGYILCWTVLAESLRHKIKLLADLSYRPAQAENTRIDKLERDHRSADVQIIESAKTCELISDSELTICRQLWTKRCLFAHPYGAQATKIDCEDIIEKTILYSMSRPVYLTKAMIEERLDDFITHPHTIPDKDQRQPVIESFLKLILPKHYATLFHALFYRIRIRYESNNVDDVFSFLLYICKSHIVINNIDLNDTKFTIDKGISLYPDTTWFIVSFKEIWEKISDPRKKNLIKYFKTTTPTRTLLYAVRNLLKSDLPAIDGLNERYYTVLKNINLSAAVNLYLDKDRMIDHIWEKFISGYQFEDQGAYISFLEINPKIITLFTPSQLNKLGLFVGISCHNGTFKAQNFVKSFSSEWLKNKDFLSGIIDGCLKSNDNTKIVFGAWYYGLIALKQLKKVDNEMFITTVADLIKVPVDKTDFLYLYKLGTLKTSLSSVMSGADYKNEYDTLSAILT